jgi:hypothetical protein
MVEVFKTNVKDKITAAKIIADLFRHFPESKINFDLDDCDNILRIDSEKVIPEKVTEVLGGKGFRCEVLE